VRQFQRLPQNASTSATGKLFADISKTPAVQSLARRLESGGVLPLAGICASAQPFFAALLQNTFPQRPVVVVTENLKTQESFQQDLETWLGLSPLFYPAWETVPNEDKLPHADVISDRLQTLVALSDNSKLKTQNSKLVVTSVTALLQKTFPPDDLKNRTRELKRGDKIAPLDLIEWLEEQGYEPEAQVSQKSEIALRGGILDVFPPTSPWPVRLEFFGDEMESLREFDPLTQVSRGEIAGITLPPAGELGILKKGIRNSECQTFNPTRLFAARNHFPAVRTGIARRPCR
jgi:transcription-repair coupling factor (superfamily II helicase)